MLTINDVISGRDNNYNLLRFLAACFIAFYHCYFMSLGPEFSDERYPALYQASQIVLNFFFIISGFLIAQSFERRRDLVSYVTARCLRLLPGVFVLSVIIAFLLGPLVTEVSLGAYFSSLKLWIYVPLTTALQPDLTLPGVFASNINAYEIDSALWTLRYEVICYIGLAVLGLIGGLRHNTIFLMVALAVGVVYGGITYASALRDIAFVNHLMHFGLSFFMGTVFYIYRNLIPLHWGLFVGAVVLGFLIQIVFGQMGEPLVLAASTYAMIWLAYIPGGFLREYNRFGDYSYGVYIYHYPVEQLFVFLFGVFSPFGLFVASLPVTIFIAVCSWVFVEKPWLQRLPEISQRIKHYGFSQGRDLQGPR